MRNKLLLQQSMVKVMEIDGVNVENMKNDEINSIIKKLYQSKTQNSGGGKIIIK